MNASDPFKRYTEKVCEQIRWKKAHAAVAKELENHLLDQKEAYIACGDPEEIAEEKALLQMGDPVAVGAALDGTHKPAPQWGMLGLVLLLLGIGTFLQLQFLPFLPEKYLQGTLHICIIPAVSIAALVLFYFFDFSFFGKYPYLLSVFLLICIPLKELFGIQVNGEHWLTLGRLVISPLQLSLFFPLGLSCVVYRFRQQGLQGYIKACFFALFTAMLLGSFFSLACLFGFAFASGIVLFTASFRNWFGTKTKPVFFGFAIAGLLFTALLLFTPQYRFHLSRITYVLHPEADPNGYGYAALLLRGMLADSKVFGMANSFIENPIISQQMMGDSLRSEYFLTFLTYRYGWAVSIGLVLLLTVFLVLGFRKCLKQKSVLGQMVSLSILSVFTAECFFYILTNLGYPFIASASLPFLSYSRDGTLIHMALAGILLSVFRTGEVHLDTVQVSSEKKRFIQWVDGTLMIHFR